MSDLALRSAVDQLGLVHSGEVSAIDLLDAALARYDRHHHDVNAVVVTRIDEARARARALDDAVAGGAEPGPLHGLPMTIKEAFDWIGTPTTWGDPAVAGHLPDRNAELVQRLLDAGAVIWGKSNVPYRLHEWQTHNELHGHTRNPWDLGRSAGGSSGGAAVAVATGMAALEIGSDIGGSIRWPAHYCGVVGHKPSFGTFPSLGHRYPGQDAEVDINVVGPIARSVADAALLLPLAARTGRPAPPLDRPLRVVTLFENPLGPDDAEMMDIIRGAADALAADGAQVRAWPGGIDLVRAHDIYRVLDAAATCELDGPQPGDAAEATRFGDGARDTAAIIGHARRMSHLEWLEWSHERQRIRWQWAELFESADVVLAPVSATPAPPHDLDRDWDDQTLPLSQGGEVSIDPQWLWAGIANGTYLPATAVPVGRTAGGLPVGLQVLGPYDGDRRCLEVAALLERLLGSVGFPPLV